MTASPQVSLHLGDCRLILPTLGRIDAIVSDPPYGVSQNSNNTRFPSIRGNNQTYRPIMGDDAPFDPTVWLNYPRVAMFGANCFSDRLPLGSWLIWCKRRDSMFGKFLADAEAIWINRGFGIYIFQHEWHGALKASEKFDKRLHPHQKPVAVVKWVIERLKIPDGATILDPYMGSGTTGIAALELGFNFVGIERDPHYFRIAEKRITEYRTALASQLPLHA